MKKLTPEEADKLSKLLAPALNFDQLERFVYLGTGDRLYDEFVGPGQPLKPTIRKLIEALELGPITDRFLRIVYREKPFQTDLRTFVVSLYPEIDAKAAREAARVEFQVGGVLDGTPSEGPGLERVVRPALRILDTEVWLDKFETIKRQVCRVEANGAGIGTGFLVGPGAVLTNWHVVNAARKRRAERHLACRFDYRRLTNGQTDPGTLVAIAEVVDERPCSSAELTTSPDSPPPKPDELDYALLRLASAVPDRGFLKLGEPPPVAPDGPIIIVQHPEGDPLRFAIDTTAVIGMHHGELRLRYRTNTSPGSSGSPCFSMDWDLLALHHLGDPAAGPVTYNQGVPVGLIRKSIEARGHAALLNG